MLVLTCATQAPSVNFPFTCTSSTGNLLALSPSVFAADADISCVGGGSVWIAITTEGP